MTDTQTRSDIVTGQLTGYWQTAAEIHARVLNAGHTWSANTTRTVLNTLVDTGRVTRETRMGKVRSGIPGILNDRKVQQFILAEESIEAAVAANAPAVAPADDDTHDRTAPAQTATGLAILFEIAYPDQGDYLGSTIVGRSFSTGEIMVYDKETDRNYWRAVDVPQCEEEADALRASAQMASFDQAAYLSPHYAEHRPTCSHETSMVRAKRALILEAWGEATEEHARRYGPPSVIVTDGPSVQVVRDVVITLTARGDRDGAARVTAIVRELHGIDLSTPVRSRKIGCAPALLVRAILKPCPEVERHAHDEVTGEIVWGEPPEPGLFTAAQYVRNNPGKKFA